VNELRVEAEHKVAGGKLVRVELEVEEGVIKRIKITGDFFLYPEEAVFKLEEALKGVRASSELEKLIEHELSKQGAELLGASPADIATAINKALTSIKP